MPFQIKQNTLNLSVPIERLAGAYFSFLFGKRIKNEQRIFK